MGSSIWKCVLTLCFFAVGGPLCAQRLEIHVLDQSTGAPVEGAVLELSGSGLQSVSDATGWIIVTEMDPGIYEGRIQRDTYAPRHIRIEIAGSEDVYHRDVQLSPLVHDLEAFEVSGGFEEGDMDAAVKRQSVTPMDQISGEALQDIADEQVSDTLEKVAGVTVNADEGEVTGINIRGAGARQTRITVDGQGIGGQGGRGTTRGVRAINRMPLEFLERIQVMKAPTPDMDADAIGGTVDLQTSRMSRLKAIKTSASLRNTYFENTGSWGNRLSVTHAHPYLLGRQRLGFLLGVNVDRAENGAGELRVLNQWPEQVDPHTGERHRALARFRVSERRSTREGFGLNLNGDWQLNEHHHFYLKSLWSEDTQELGLESLSYDFIRGEVQSVDAVSGSFEKMRLEKQFLERHSQNRAGSLVLGGEHHLGAWFLEESIGYSYTEDSIPDSRLSQFRTGRDYLGLYQLHPHWKSPSIKVTDPSQPGLESVAGDPAPYAFFRYDLIDKQAQDEELAARAHLSRPWRTGSAEWLFKGGVKGRFRESDIDQDSLPYRSASGGFFLPEVAGDGEFFAFGSRYSLGPRFSTQSMRQFYEDNTLLFRAEANDILLESSRSDFSVSESIYAAYAMVQRESEKWIFITGVRFERTQSDSTGYEILQSRNNGESTVNINRRTVSDSYDMAFPGIHLMYRPGGNVVFRTSLTRALQRPDFRDLSPSTRVNLDTRRIRAGNPELEPFDAKAADVGMDAVLNAWSRLSLGVFYKRIDDFIVDVEEETEYLGEPGYVISRPVNGSPAKLYGLEAAFETGLSFLPEPLDALSLNINYTWTDSTAAYPGHPREVIMLPEQVRQTLNASLHWQYHNWTVNFRSRYRGLQLMDLVEPGQDRFFRGYWNHSLSIRYKLNDSVSLSISANNLTTPSRIQYQGREGRLVLNREGSRVFSLGLNVSFGKGPRIEIQGSREAENGAEEDS